MDDIEIKQATMHLRSLFSKAVLELVDKFKFKENDKFEPTDFALILFSAIAQFTAESICNVYNTKNPTKEVTDELIEHISTLTKDMLDAMLKSEKKH